jgi:hypothetical protein
VRCGCHSDRTGAFWVAGLGERRRLAGTTSRSASTTYVPSVCTGPNPVPCDHRAFQLPPKWTPETDFTGKEHILNEALFKAIGGLSLPPSSGQFMLFPLQDIVCSFPQPDVVSNRMLQAGGPEFQKSLCLLMNMI